MSNVDSVRVDGVAYGIQDGGAVRFDAAQSLTDTEKTRARANIGAVSDSEITNVVRYTAQSKTTAEKTQARANIGAVSDAELTDVVRYTSQSKTTAQKAQARMNIGAGAIDNSQVDNALNAKRIYHPGDTSIYVDGLESTTNIYFITDGAAPIVIPKGSTIAEIYLLNPSTTHHSVCLYFFERRGSSFKLLQKITGLTIDYSIPFSIDLKPFDTDVYIGIRNEISYSLRYCNGDISGISSGKIITFVGSEPAIGEVITPDQWDAIRAFGLSLTIYLPTEREIVSDVGNNSFLFQKSDIVSEIDWITGKGFYSFDNGTTISNYGYMLIDSTAGDTSGPIRIRDNSGNLINNIKISDVQFYSEAFVAAEFDKYGSYIRVLTAGDFSERGFSDDCYYAVLRRFTAYDTRFFIEPIIVDWIHTSSIYTVGANGDFHTFTEMLRALNNDASEKTVYVEAGVYDIYAEKGGADYIATITNPSALNWRDVCEVVPDNTRIIGVGKVLLRWNPPADVIGSNDMAFLFSPLNVSGSCHIENIEIECTNCRYAIHDETSSYPKWKRVERFYRNIRAKKIHGIYGNDQVYAAGISPTGSYTFENCYFEGDRNWMFSMHTTEMSANDKVIVNIKNCVFIRTGTDGYQTVYMIGFGNTHTAKRYVDVNFDSCWLNGNVMLYAEGNMSNAVNAYSVKTIGCNAVRITPNGVANDQQIIQKNSLENTKHESELLRRFGPAPMITAENTVNDTIPVLTLYGKSTQETTTGKNLLPNSATSQTVNGVTFTVHPDGSIAANGTATSNSQLQIYFSGLSAGVYRFSGAPTGGSDHLWHAYMWDATVNARPSNETGGEAASDYGNGANFVMVDGHDMVYVMRIMSGYTASNLVFYPMIRLASITDATYEPYTGGQPSPSPDYPQAISSVGDSGSVSIIISDDAQGTGAVTTSLPTPNGLPGIPVSSGGNFTDSNGQRWICDTIDKVTGKYVQRIGQIASYDGETISDPWLSSKDVYVAGGTPTIGATVIYALTEHVTTDLTVAQIAALDALRSHEDTTVIYTTDAVEPEMAAKLWVDIGSIIG